MIAALCCIEPYKQKTWLMCTTFGDTANIESTILVIKGLEVHIVLMCSNICLTVQNRQGACAEKIWYTVSSTQNHKPGFGHHIKYRALCILHCTSQPVRGSCSSVVELLVFHL